MRIEQTIFVERDSQKAIVLGKGGRTIKQLSMSRGWSWTGILERPVHLFLFVKVREDWGDDPERYREHGAGVSEGLIWRDRRVSNWRRRVNQYDPASPFFSPPPLRWLCSQALRMDHAEAAVKICMAPVSSRAWRRVRPRTRPSGARSRPGSHA